MRLVELAERMDDHALNSWKLELELFEVELSWRRPGNGGEEGWSDG